LITQAGASWRQGAAQPTAAPPGGSIPATSTASCLQRLLFEPPQESPACTIHERLLQRVSNRQAHSRMTHPPGSMTHPPGSMTHPPGSMTHPPGSMTHPPGRMTHLPGSMTHPPGSRHQQSSSSNHLPEHSYFQQTSGYDLVWSQDIILRY